MVVDYSTWITLYLTRGEGKEGSKKMDVPLGESRMLDHFEVLPYTRPCRRRSTHIVATGRRGC